ncbi:MAG: hypothetical protein JO019_03220 [Candidatus Kaiserbacteria bacterium]|nr:hypothetical protein [Candidatus Kaiserbacteria bacterium]
MIIGTADIFKNAALAIYAYEHHGTCDTEAIGQAIVATTQLETDVAELGKHLRTAYENLYGNVKDGLGILEQELAEERKLLERIRDSEKLTDRELARVTSFCSEIWVQLRLAEQGLRPHRVTH